MNRKGSREKGGEERNRMEREENEGARQDGSKERERKTHQTYVNIYNFTPLTMPDENIFFW